MHEIIGCEHKDYELGMYSGTLRAFFNIEGKTDDKKKYFFPAYCKISKQVFSAMQKLYKDKEYALSFVKTVREKRKNLLLSD